MDWFANVLAGLYDNEIDYVSDVLNRQIEEQLEATALQYLEEVENADQIPLNPEYDELNPQLQNFIDQNIYELASPEGRRLLLTNASVNYGVPILPPQVETPVVAGYENINMRGYAYAGHTTFGEVYRYDYVFREEYADPTRALLFTVLSEFTQQIDTVNITLNFHNGDRSERISLSQADLERIMRDNSMNQNEAVDVALNFLNGSTDWMDNLYISGATGSDHAVDIISTMDLDPSCFSVYIVRHRGGSNEFNATPTFFSVLNIPSTGNDCLIECFRYFRNIALSNEDVRAFLKVPLGQMLEPKHAKILEKVFGIEVRIVEDSLLDVNNLNPNSFKTLHGAGSKLILFYENHYDVISEINDAGEALSGLDRHLTANIDPSYELKDTEKGVEYMFFDVETTYDEKYTLSMYAWSVVKCDKTGSIVDSYTCLNMNEGLVERLNIMRTPGHKVILVGFNNSRFDSFMLMEQLIQKEISVYNTVIAGSSLLSFRFGSFVVRDLCRMLTCSLKKACESFKCKYPKGDFDHELAQKAAHEGQLGDFVNSNAEAISFYVKRDCEALSELYFKCKSAVRELVDADLDDYSTVASLAYDSFKNTLSDELKKKIPVERSNHVDDFIRRSIIGGRSQIYKGEYKDLCSIDAVSLYPFVLDTYEYPIGKAIKTGSYVEGKIGVYRVKVGVQPQTKHIIPLRGDTLDWDHGTENWCVLNTVDINCLIDHGVPVQITSGYYWDESRYGIFSPYSEKLKSEKKRQDTLNDSEDEEYNPALREFCKLMLNAISGKVAQRKYKTKSVLVSRADILTDVKKQFKGKTIKYHLGPGYAIVEGEKLKTVARSPVIWGSLVYSYARTYMYKKIISKLPVYGCDTDSAFIPSKYLEGGLEKYGIPIGSEFGEFKVETRNHDAILVAPKNYVFFGKTIIKSRFKGVNLGRDKVLGVKNIDGLSAKDVEYLFKSSTAKIGVGDFRKMLMEKLYVITSSLNKRLTTDSKKPLSIKQRFTVKVCSSEGIRSWPFVVE